MKKVKIAVIDTYVDVKNLGFENDSVRISEFCPNYNIKDNLHGALVCSQILAEFSNVQITVFPVFSNENYAVDPKEILKILEYIYECGNYNLINMSFGMLDCDCLDELRIICHKLVLCGTIILAAFDNDGAMSYPAALEEVIGIDIIPEKKSKGGYQYIINSEINIRADGKIKRIKFGNKYMLASGTSFVVPIFTGKIAKYIFESNFHYNLDTIRSFLKSNADEILNLKIFSLPNNELKISNAIVLPINKENHSLMRFKKLLKFNIVGFYDFKYQLNIGKKVSYFTNCDEDNDVIEEIDKIPWCNNFDTVIIGHIDTIANLAGKEIIMSLLKKCLMYNKKVVAYDNFIYNNFILGNNELHGLKLYFPYINDTMIPYARFGKLWYISKPILNILGTRSQIGKFTAQIKIIKGLQKRGYNVGYLSSEPTGLFFGAKYVFPFGYNSTVNISLNNYPAIVNEMLHRIDEEKNDIIVTGGQSGIVPYDLFNTSRILLPQIAYLYATNPDAVVLCVSCDDELEYIQRNISFIESSCDTNVIALLLFPVEKQMNFLGNYFDVNIENENRYKEKQKELHNSLNLPVYSFFDDSFNECVDLIIDYFSAET